MFRLFLCLFLIGCGTTEPQIQIIEKTKEVPMPFYIAKEKVDIKLLPYVMEFAGYCEKFQTSSVCQKNFKKIKAIKTVESFPEKFVIGKCYILNNEEREIEINKSWFDLDSFSMRTVIIHELAHCTLGTGKADFFPHYDVKDDIMNSYLLPENILFYDWPELLKTMFQRAGGKLSLTDEEEVVTVTQTVMDSSGGFACETRKD